jgi:hypothetical protein
MVQLNPARVAIEFNHNTLNQLKWLTSTCRFAPVHSNIVVLTNSLVLHLSGQNVLTACFGGKFLNRTWVSIKATEIISSYLRAPVQGWAHSNDSSLAENISTKQRGPNDLSGVAISRQEWSQEQKNKRSTLRYPTPQQGWAQSNDSSLAENISTAQRGPHDRSGVAISHQEWSQEHKKQQERPPVPYAATGRAKFTCLFNVHGYIQNVLTVWPSMIRRVGKVDGKSNGSGAGPGWAQVYFLRQSLMIDYDIIV